MTSPISKLDADVSYIITSMLDKKDLSSFMKTCHTIYHTGIPQLLSGDVSIHSYLALESFQRFMFAEVLPPTDTTTMARRNAIRPRFKFLHGLNIQFWTRPRTEPLILADIVEKSIELRRLMLPRCDETIFYLSTRTTQRIADVLDTLPVLQKLFLSETKALHTPIILTSLRRPTSITELSLIINSKVNFSSSSLALSSIRNTLTKLTLNDQILHHGLINHPSDVSSIPFTKVQELTILTKGIHVDRILVFMVQTFPSLKRLSFTQTPTLQTSPTSPSLQTLRESNQADYFQRYRNNLPVNGVLMKSLDSCSGETGHLYSLGLTIPIRQLSIRHCLDREQISLLRDVLEDVGPSVVGLRLCGWDVLSGRLGLREIAGGASASITRGRESLAGIFLEVVMYDHDLENYSAIWASLKESLYGLSLLTIALEFTYRLKPRNPHDHNQVPPTSFETKDLHEYATGLINAVPTLQQLSIKVDNFPERNKAWYVLGLDSGPRSLVAMSEQATRSFLRQSKGIGFDDND